MFLLSQPVRNPPCPPEPKTLNLPKINNLSSSNLPPFAPAQSATQNSICRNKSLSLIPMAASSTLRNGLAALLPLALAFTIYLYLYPFFNTCAFPLPSRDVNEAFEVTKKLHWPYTQDEIKENGTKLAPFRLLALGDPQLEGDTSIPTNIHGYLPHLKSIAQHLTFQTEHTSLRERLRQAAHDTVDVYFEDIPNILESLRKRIDLFGNDFYMGHIYRTMHWWARPTHVTVLGDLVGSQWIDDAEFERRGKRYWERTFRGGERLPDDLAAYPEKDYRVSGVLGKDENIWTRRILNVAGNHDIGYAGDITPELMERFERVFGVANYELRFQLPIPTTNTSRVVPEIRIVVMNDMNLDTPAKSTPLQDETYAFINAVIGTAHPVDVDGGITLVLTHIPMYKPAGICVDAPFFDFHEDGVKEQFLLSGDASKGFLEGIFGISANTAAAGKGMGRPGLVLNGHDHEGCDTYHFINQTNGTSSADRSWEVKRWADAEKLDMPGRQKIPGRREITVRSMMGDFGGNAGLLSLWFDEESWEWRSEYMDCGLGTQHFWWFVHIFDLGVLLSAVVYLCVKGAEMGGVDVEKALGWGMKKEEGK